MGSSLRTKHHDALRVPRWFDLFSLFADVYRLRIRVGVMCLREEFFPPLTGLPDASMVSGKGGVTGEPPLTLRRTPDDGTHGLYADQ